MLLQLLQRTVCMNAEPTDTLSASTTQLTAVAHAPAPMGKFTVSASPALSLPVLTPSRRSAARPAKVKLICPRIFFFFLSVETKHLIKFDSVTICTFLV